MTGLGNIDDVYKHYLKVIEENKRLEKSLRLLLRLWKNTLIELIGIKMVYLLENTQKVGLWLIKP